MYYKYNLFERWAKRISWWLDQWVETRMNNREWSTSDPGGADVKDERKAHLRW